MGKRLTMLLFVVVLAVIVSGSAAAGTIPSGWTCTGGCGSMGADGVVPLSPYGSSEYQYATTVGGVGGAGRLPTGAIGGETNGSSLATSVFSANAGTKLDFYFDYVTSDGSQYNDYGWAALVNANNPSDVTLLFTARTYPSGSIVPGPGMPLPAATLNPTSIPITAGTTWAPIGPHSGGCYGPGCGNTGWVQSTYFIPNAGDYYLEIGVTNLLDQIWDSGIAMDGVKVDDKPIIPTPEPATLTLLAAGLLGGLGMFRRK